MIEPTRRRRRLVAALLALAGAASGACGGHPGHPGHRGPPGQPLGTAPGIATLATTGATGPSGAAASPADWFTYQHDVARSGKVVDRFSAGVRRAWARDGLDGAVYAQPLIVGDAVVVATEGDSLYRLDAATGVIRWRTQLGRPVPLSELPCGNIDPVGITGTPVIDRATGLVWAVAFVEPHRHDLVAVDLATGAIRQRQSVDPPGADPSVHLQRAALTLTGGRVYVAFGGLYGDCGSYRGQVVATSAALNPGGQPGDLSVFHVPTGREGGIWSPAGAVVDASGDLVVATGNSGSSTGYDEGNSVLRLSPDLRQLDAFAPANWAELSSTDSDLGSVAPALVGPGQVFQVGKAGIGYLLAADHFGGIGGARAQGPVCPEGGAYGATAWVSPLVMVACESGLVAVRISAGSFAIAWRGPKGSAGPPAISQGEVWSVELSSGDLVGVDAATGALRQRLHVGPVPHFAPVAIGGGRLVVPSSRGVVAFAG